MLVLREMYQRKSLEDILQNARVSDINFAHSEHPYALKGMGIPARILNLKEKIILKTVKSELF